MNDYDLNQGTNDVDLTLKLGLPDTDDQYLFNRNHSATNLMNFSSPYSQEINHNGMVNERGNPQVEHNFIDASNQTINPPEMGSNAYTEQPNPLGQFSSSFNGVPAYINSHNNINPSLVQIPPTPMRNNNATLDTFETFLELVNSSPCARGGRGTGRQRVEGFYDPNRRCTNCNCNTNDTPMWRNGPLGYKTLCNACGIKYRKLKNKIQANIEAANN